MAIPWGGASACTGRPRKTGLVHVDGRSCFGFREAYVYITSPLKLEKP